MNIDVTGVFQQNWDAIHELNPDGSRKYKYILNIGSSRSSKTYSLIDCYDLYARGNRNKRMTVWRSTKKDCKDTVMDDYLKRLVSTDRFERYRFNKTESVYLYGNNSKIEFRGADEDGAHGLTQDCAWLNEPYEIPAETFHQIDQRTSDFVFIDLNPKQNHWSDDLLTNPRTYIIHSTFRDNPFCPPEQKAKILSYDPENEINVKNKTANLFRWQVYGLGIKGEVEGKVFSNYEVIEEIPLSAKPYGKGFDYGYSMDPTAIIGLYEWPEMDRDGARAVILDEIVYATGLQPTPLNTTMRKALMNPNDLIIGDRTAQLMMDELYDRGWVNIHAAKGDNSIDYGISKMQELRIYITARSKNLIYEFDNYKNQKDKFGKYINTPEKNQQDHGIDGSRYIITDWVTRKAFFVV